MGRNWKGPSQIWKNRISSWEGTSMYKPAPDTGKINNSFETEAQGFINSLPISVRSKLPDSALDALYSYSYNVGVGNFRKRVLPILTQYVEGKASAEDVVSHMYGTKDAKYRGLQNRRAYEKEAFLRGVNSPSNTNFSSRNTAPYTPTASPYTTSLGRINIFTPKNSEGYTVPNVENNKSSFWNSYTAMPEVPVNKPEPVSSVEYEPMFKTNTNVNTGSDYLNTIYSEQLEKMQDSINADLVEYKKQQDTVNAINQRLASLEATDSLLDNNNIFAEGGYTVQKGDSLWKIAKKNNLNFQDLLAANSQLEDPNKIFEGDIINLPSNNTVPSRNKPVEEYGSSYEFSDSNNKNPNLRYKRNVTIGTPRFLDKAEADILEKKVGHVIERNEDGGTYAVTDDDSNIKSVGTSFELPTAETSVYSRATLSTLKGLADIYLNANNIYNGTKDPKVAEEQLKQLQAYSKATGISPHDAYFLFNKYVAEHGANIPKSYYTELGLDDAKIQRLATAYNENKNSDAYQYLFNPKADVLRSYIDTDKTIVKAMPAGLRLGLAGLTNGLSEVGFMGDRAIGALNEHAWNNTEKDATNSKQKDLAHTMGNIFSNINKTLDVTDPFSQIASGISSLTTPNIYSTQDLYNKDIVDPNNYLGTFGAGFASGLTMPGPLPYKLSMGIASGLAGDAAQYGMINDNNTAGVITSSAIPAITSVLLNKGQLSSWGANSIRNAINTTARATTITGVETAKRLGAEALANYMGLSPEDKTAFVNGMSTAIGMGAETTRTGRNLQNWMYNMTPGATLIGNTLNHSGGAPSARSALFNVANHQPNKAMSIGLHALMQAWDKAQQGDINQSLRELGIGFKNSIAELNSPTTNAQDNISYTYNGTTVNSATRRQVAADYDAYQRKAASEGLHYGDYGVPENFTYTDVNGKTMRVAGTSEVSQQAKAIKQANGDIAFPETTAPLWSIVAGEVTLKPGQKVEYGDATVSTYTLPKGNPHYNASDSSKNNVILVEYKTRNTDIGSKVMGSQGRVQTTRALEEDLRQQGYTEDTSSHKVYSHNNVDRARIKGTTASNKPVDMNLKGAILETKVYKSPTGNKDQDIFVMHDQDYASAGSARAHYAKGEDALQIERAKQTLGINNKANFVDKHITQNSYTVDEANALLNKVHSDLSTRDASITKNVTVPTLSSNTGVLSKTAVKNALSSYMTEVYNNVNVSNTKGTEARRSHNANMRNLIMGGVHRVVSDLGSVSYTREEVKAKLPELKKELATIEKKKSSYNISTFDSQESLRKLYEYQQELGKNLYIRKKSNGEYEYTGGASITLPAKKAEEIGIDAEYNQSYTDDATQLKALIAFGES